ncbi:MAG: NADH-quinone oxidoreductase subunit C [Candidatus Latescibacteria bacterium]|nr:NADH-quinone oxidoreductase subunit C [Candidatus Latescibacterota bacterium]
MADNEKIEVEEAIVEEAVVDSSSGTVRELKEHFSDAVLDYQDALSEETVTVERSAIIAVLRFLKDESSTPFTRLCDLTAVDRLYLDEDVRFAVVYHLHSHLSNQRIRIKVPVPESDPVVGSAASVWPAADWMEREVYDLYGIEFEGHPDLRRLVMPDDFGAHPLRKDYPLHGNGERDNFAF